MVLKIKNDITGYVEEFRLNSLADFDKLFEEYPSVHHVAMTSHNLKEAAFKVARHLSNGYMSVQVEEGMSKASNWAAGAAISAALMATPGAALVDANQPKPPMPIAAQAEPAQPKRPVVKHVPFGSAPEDKFLVRIRQIESSGGKNTNHLPVEAGPLKGQVAIGGWGLMKPTIDDVINKYIKSKRVTPDMLKLQSMSRDEADSFLSRNPHMELELARMLAKFVLKRHNNDEHRAAFSWLHGHNLSSDQISDDDLKHVYVEQYRGLSSLPMTFKSVNKKTELFRVKFTKWTKKRQAEAREPSPRDTTFVPDPGRIRNDVEIEKPSNTKKLQDYVAVRTGK